MPADGGEAIRDLAVLRDQHEVFGPLASTPTAWRVPAGIDATALNALRAARARAREVRAARLGIPFAVVANRRAVLRPLQVSQVDSALPLHPTVADAVAAVRLLST